MIELRACRLDDLAQVANLHRRVFHHCERPAAQALVDYYREVFFENPWRQDDIVPLVCVSHPRGVVGFVGVVPRPMRFGARDLRVAVAHRLMVAPGERAGMVAARLLRALLSGPQDLLVSDGANADGKRAMTAAGAVVLPGYSFNWVRPLRPLRLLVGWVAHQARRRRIAEAVTPWLRRCERVLPSAAAWPCPGWGSPRHQTRPLDEATLLDAIDLFSRERTLGPRYDARSLAWLLARLRADPDRGSLDGLALCARDGRLLGTCLYCVKKGESAEVLQITAAPGQAVEVLRALLSRAWEEGLTHVFGRLEPSLMGALWEVGARPLRGCWAVGASRSPEVMDALFRGDAFLSDLEAELWGAAPGSLNWEAPPACAPGLAARPSPG